MYNEPNYDGVNHVRLNCSKTSGCTASDRYDMRPSRIITGYRLSQKRSIFASDMYSKICVQWAGNHFGLGLT